MTRKSLILTFWISFLTVAGASGLNNLYIVDASAGPQTSITIRAGVSNSDAFNAFQFDLLFPAELTWIAGGVRLTSRAQGHSVSASLVNPGRLRVIAWSLTNASFTGTTGNIVELDFRTGDQPGTFPLILENAVLSGSAGNIINGIANGTFSLLASQLSVSVSEIDYGRVPLLKEEFRQVTLTNSGNQDLTINSLIFSDSRFSSSAALPFIIPSGGYRDLNIRFFSTAKGAFDKTLTITSNDPQGARVCSLKAIAFAVNEIHMGSASGRSGYDVEIPVTVNNMEDFCAMQFRITLPQVVRFIKGSEVLDNLRKNDHIISADTSGNILTILVWSPANKKFNGSEGKILTFRLHLEGAGGNYPLGVTDPAISSLSSENILSASYGADVRITAPSISASMDILDFGNVSVLETGSINLTIYNNGDDNLLVSSVTPIDPAFGFTSALPLTILSGNSKVIPVTFHTTDGLVHTSTLRVRSNDAVNDPLDISLRARSFLPNEIRVLNCSAMEGTRDTIFLELFNQSKVSGFQFDLEYPSSAVINPAEIFLTSRKKDHFVTASIISAGRIRVLSYSGTLKEFTGTEGPVMGIPVNISPGFTGTYPLDLSGVVISDINSKSVETGSRSANLIVELSTGYDEILNNGIKVYPNPADDFILIEFPGSRPTRIIVLNLQGSIIMEYQNNGNPAMVKTDLLLPGVYILVFEYDNKLFRFRMIKR